MLFFLFHCSKLFKSTSSCNYWDFNHCLFRLSFKHLSQLGIQSAGELHTYEVFTLRAHILVFGMSLEPNGQAGHIRPATFSVPAASPALARGVLLDTPKPLTGQLWSRCCCFSLLPWRRTQEHELFILSLKQCISLDGILRPGCCSQVQKIISSFKSDHSTHRYQESKLEMNSVFESHITSMCLINRKCDGMGVGTVG